MALQRCAGWQWPRTQPYPVWIPPQVAPVFAMQGAPKTPAPGQRFSSPTGKAGSTTTRLELKALFEVIGGCASLFVMTRRGGIWFHEVHAGRVLRPNSAGAARAGARAARRSAVRERLRAASLRAPRPRRHAQLEVHRGRAVRGVAQLPAQDTRQVRGPRLWSARERLFFSFVWAFAPRVGGRPLPLPCARLWALCRSPGPLPGAPSPPHPPPGGGY